MKQQYTSTSDSASLVLPAKLNNNTPISTERENGALVSARRDEVENILHHSSTEGSHPTESEPKESEKKIEQKYADLDLEGRRILNPESEQGRNFQRQMQERLEQIYEKQEITNERDDTLNALKKHNFSAYPVKFYFSLNASPNAFATKTGSNEYAIVINSGCFTSRTFNKEGRVLQEPVIASNFDLLHLLLHEMTHIKLLIREGEDKRNSKGEESLLCNMGPVYLLEQAGHNPEEALWTFEKWKNSKKRRLNIVERYHDPHLDGKLELDILRDGLTALRIQHGAFTSPLSSAVTGLQTERMEQKIKENAFVTTVLKKMNYEKLSAINKLGALESLLDDCSQQQVRLEDLVEKIKELGKQDNISAAWKNAQDSFAEKILQVRAGNADMRRDRALVWLLLALTHSTSTGGETPPITKPLRILEGQLQQFITICEMGTKTEIGAAAKSLSEYTQSDEMKGYKQLISRFTWPHFRLPDSDNWISPLKEELDEDENSDDEYDEYEDDWSCDNNPTTSWDRDNDDEYPGAYDEDEENAIRKRHPESNLTLEDVEMEIWNEENAEEQDNIVVVPWNSLYLMLQSGDNLELTVPLCQALQSVDTRMQNLIRSKLERDEYGDAITPPDFLQGIPLVKGAQDGIYELKITEEGYVQKSEVPNAKEDDIIVADGISGAEERRILNIIRKDHISEEEAKEADEIFQKVLIRRDTASCRGLILGLYSKHYYRFGNIGEMFTDYGEDTKRSDVIITMLRISALRNMKLRMEQDAGAYRQQTAKFCSSNYELFKFSPELISNLPVDSVTNHLQHYLLQDPHGIFHSPAQKWETLLGEYKSSDNIGEDMGLLEAESVIKLIPNMQYDGIFPSVTPRNAAHFISLWKHIHCIYELPMEQQAELANEALTTAVLSATICFINANNISFRQALNLLDAMGSEGNNESIVQGLRSRITSNAGRVLKAKNTKKVITDVAVMVNNALLKPKRAESLVGAVVERLIQLEVSEKREELILYALRKIEFQDNTMRDKLVTQLAQNIAHMCTPLTHPSPILEASLIKAKHVLRLTEQISLLRTIAIETNAQPAEAYNLQCHLPDIKQEHYAASNKYGSRAELILTLARNEREYAQELIEYLLHKKNTAQQEKLVMKILNAQYRGKSARYLLACEQILWRGKVDKETLEQIEHNEKKHPKEFIKEVEHNIEKTTTALEMLHKQFWEVPLELRAVLTKQLMFGDTGEEERSELVKKVIGDLIGEAVKGKYDESAKNFLLSYTAEMPPYMHPSVVSALMSASQASEDKRSIGKTLSAFAEAMGPAEILTCQIVPAHPKMPKEIVADMEHLKYAAAADARWNILRLAEKAARHIQETTGLQIQRYGKLAGAGKLFYALQVQLEDGRDQILALLRLYSIEKADTGFTALGNTAMKVSQEFGVVLEEMVEHGKISLIREADCSLALAQYEKAKKMYGNTTLTSAGVTTHFNVPGVNASGEGYYLMDELPGEHLIDHAQTPETKRHRMHDFTLLISNILNLLVEDDRHGGNAKIEGNTINHFDFKSTSLDEWTDEQIVFAVSTIITQLQQTAFSSSQEVSVLELVNSITPPEDQEEKSNRNLLTEIKKALITAADTTKDFSTENYKHIFISALMAGVSPRVEQAILSKMPQHLYPVVQGLMGGNKSLLPLVGMKEKDLIVIQQG